MKRILISIVFLLGFANTVFGQSNECKLWFDLKSNLSSSVVGYYNKSQLSNSDSIIVLPTYVSYNYYLYNVGAISNNAFSDCSFLKKVLYVEDTLQLNESNVLPYKYDANIEPITIGTLSTLPIDGTYYQLTGKVSGIKSSDLYGNFDLTDATGTAHVLGLLSERGGAKKQFQELVKEKGIVDGCTLTLIGKHGDYNGKVEVVDAYFVSVLDGDTPTPPGPTPDPTNLDGFKNGDFETWTDNQPTYWNTVSTAGNATLAQSTDAHSGRYSVLVKTGNSANKRLGYREMALEAGKYVVSFYAKGAAGNDAASVRPGYVPVTDGSVGSYAYGEYTNNITSSEWVQITHTFELKATTTVSLIIMNPKNYGDVLIDDYSIKIIEDNTRKDNASKMSESRKSTIQENSVGEHAFSGCSNLESVVLPESITNIDAYAFCGCTNLQSLYMPQDIQRVDTNAFFNCPNLVQLSVTTHQTKVEINTSHGFVSQNKIRIFVNDKETDKNGCINIQHLSPNTYYDTSIQVFAGDVLIYRMPCNYQTKSLNPALKYVNGTTTLKVIGSYEEEDAKVIKTALIGPNKDIVYDVDSIQFDNLRPDCSYKILYRLYYNTDAYEEYSIYAYTSHLGLKTNVPKVVDKTSAIVGATTNIPEDEIHIGFEWRKIDAPELVPSKVGSAYIYNGVMESKIMGLSTDSYYKVRPFYESFDGNKYYGDWIGFDPSDCSYTDPTVHTYNINTPLTSNQVTVRGYVIAGTDNIEEQGFEYWPIYLPLLKLTIAGTGQSMVVTLSDLMYNTIYAVRAYVKTATGTTYGETITFNTPLTDDIDCAHTNDKKDNDAIYDIQGRLIGSSKIMNLKSLSKGIYIVNGKKVLIH